MVKELILNNEYVEEVYEILCGIPFESPTIIDNEPPTKRHPGIEQLISQLEKWVVDDDEIFDCDCESCVRRQRLHLKMELK